MKLEKKLENLLHEEILHELLVGNIVEDIEEAEDLWFISMIVDNKTSHEKDEDALDLLMKGRNALKEMKGYLEDKSLELSNILEELKGEGIYDCKVGEKISNLINTLETQDFEFSNIGTQEITTYEGTGETTVQIEYEIKGGKIMVDNFDVHFEYSVNNLGEEDISVTSIALSNVPLGE